MSDSGPDETPVDDEHGTQLPSPMSLDRLYSRLGAAEALGFRVVSPEVLERLGNAVLGDRKSISNFRMTIPELESKFPPSYWQSLTKNPRFAESAASVASLYPRDHLAIPPRSPRPRR